MDTEIITLNSIPTFENLMQVNDNLGLPDVKKDVLFHRKEHMIYMIINLLRVKPKIFLFQMESLKSKYERGAKPRTMMFYSNDVEQCINLLQLSEPMHALELSEELCQMCQE